EQLLGGLQSLDGGLIHKALHDPTKAAHRKALVQMMSWALGLTAASESKRDHLQGMQAVEVFLSFLNNFCCALTVEIRFLHAFSLFSITSLTLNQMKPLPK
ncbi:hypothetical protein ILYODFUR_038901, partial [Ilyodon furcidens]